MQAITIISRLTECANNFFSTSTSTCTIVIFCRLCLQPLYPCTRRRKSSETLKGTCEVTGNLITMLRVKRDFFLQSHFEYFFLTSFYPSVFTSHSSSNSRVSEVSTLLLRFYDVRSAMDSS